MSSEKHIPTEYVNPQGFVPAENYGGQSNAGYVPPPQPPPFGYVEQSQSPPPPQAPQYAYNPAAPAPQPTPIGYPPQPQQPYPYQGYPQAVPPPQQPPYVAYQAAAAPPPPPQPTIVFTTQETRFQRSKRYRPQVQSLTAATMIFLISGLEIGWGNLNPLWLTPIVGTQVRTNILTGFFAGVIIGAFISAIAVSRIPKKFFYYAAGLLALISGIIYTSAQTLDAFVAARYLDGIAVGLTVIPAIISCGEVAVKTNRGLVSGTEFVNTATGIAITSIYMSLWVDNTGFTPTQMHGVLIIVSALFALGTCLLVIETPVYHLQKDDEASALVELQKLEKQTSPTPEIYEALDSLKRLVDEDQQTSLVAKLSAGAIPFGKLALFRSVVALSISLPIATSFFFSTSLGLQNSYGLYVNSLLRWLGTLISSMILIDRVGRKNLSLLSLLVGLILLFNVAAAFTNLYSLGQTDAWTQMAGLLMTYQFFAGLLMPVSTTYLSEAFLPSVKPYFIFGSIFVENMIQIICALSLVSNPTFQIDTFFYVFGCIQVVVFLLTLTLPETKNLTLHECTQRFRKIYNGF